MFRERVRRVILPPAQEVGTLQYHCHHCAYFSLVIWITGNCRISISWRRLSKREITMELNRCISPLVPGWYEIFFLFFFYFIWLNSLYFVNNILPRTIFVLRYVSAERYSDALNVLQSGACLQLDKAQVIFVFSSTCTI